MLSGCVYALYNAFLNKIKTRREARTDYVFKLEKGDDGIFFKRSKKMIIIDTGS